MSDWDFRVSGYRKTELLSETVHKGVASMQMEIDAWKSRMGRGDCTQIRIVDLRPEWVRSQHGTSPWAKDLTEVINYIPTRPKRTPHDQRRG